MAEEGVLQRSMAFQTEGRSRFGKGDVSLSQDRFVLRGIWSSKKTLDTAIQISF